MLSVCENKYSKTIHLDVSITHFYIQSHTTVIRQICLSPAVGFRLLAMLDKSNWSDSLLINMLFSSSFQTNCLLLAKSLTKHNQVLVQRLSRQSNKQIQSWWNPHLELGMKNWLLNLEEVMGQINPTNQLKRKHRNTSRLPALVPKVGGTYFFNTKLS